MTLLAGNFRDILGTETLYLGVALALLLGGDLDLDLDLLPAGERDRLLGDRDLFLEDLGMESLSLSSFQSCLCLSCRSILASLTSFTKSLLLSSLSLFLCLCLGGDLCLCILS